MLYTCSFLCTSSLGIFLRHVEEEKVPENHITFPRSDSRMFDQEQIYSRHLIRSDVNWFVYVRNQFGEFRNDSFYQN